MSLDDNTTKIILAIIAVISILVSGAFVSIKKNKSRKHIIKNIEVKGHNSKIVGGDDHSVN